MAEHLTALATRYVKRALNRPSFVPAEEEAYRRLATKGFKPAYVIDVGAYEGNWSRLAHRVFGDTPTLMIEAQESKKAILEKVCAELASVTLVSAPLGASSGERVTFYEMETGSSFMPERSNVPRTERTLVTRTLDEVAVACIAPVFLKIDVQGAELQVLAGGSETLARAEVVQLEVAVLSFNEGAPTMLEVLAFMDERGFAPFDVSGSSRPNGIDLVQIDLLFVRHDSPLRATYFNF